MDFQDYDIEKEKTKLINSEEYDKKRDEWERKNPKNQSLRDWLETPGDGSFRI